MKSDERRRSFSVCHTCAFVQKDRENLRAGIMSFRADNKERALHWEYLGTNEEGQLIGMSTGWMGPWNSTTGTLGIHGNWLAKGLK